MSKKTRHHAILTEHIESPEDRELREALYAQDTSLHNQFLMYLSGVAIYYALLHLVFPSHWPLYEMLTSTFGVVALLSRNSNYRMVGWLLLAVSALSAIVTLARG